jgi:hypothetical protein
MHVRVRIFLVVLSRLPWVNHICLFCISRRVIDEHFLSVYPAWGVPILYAGRDQDQSECCLVVNFPSMRLLSLSFVFVCTTTSYKTTTTTTSIAPWWWLRLVSVLYYVLLYIITYCCCVQHIYFLVFIKLPNSSLCKCYIQKIIFKWVVDILT